MGVVADTALAHGGHVIGVIPSAMVAREIAHRGLPDLRIVSSMHERKALMARLSDAFIALPGGFGTFEEFCEVVTWTQLGLHRMPTGAAQYRGVLRSARRLVRPCRLRRVHQRRKPRDRCHGIRPGSLDRPPERAAGDGRIRRNSGRRRP